MIKEWATVVSWQQGVAVLRCEPLSGCGSCQSRTSCGSGLLSKAGGSAEHELTVNYQQPLVPGQKVEIGIAETSLLQSALLVYLVPLLGLMLGAVLFHAIFASELAAAAGAIIGTAASFWGVHRWSAALANSQRYQPVILQVSFPGSLLRVDTSSDR